MNRLPTTKPLGGDGATLSVPRRRDRPYLHVEIVYRDDATGEISILCLWLATRTRWRRMALTDPLIRAFPVGALVVAVKLDGGTVPAEGGAAC